MKIKINGITAEGFRSLAEKTTVDLDRVGLNLVKGINGAGKTTIFEVVVWCIFGTNLKDTNVDKIPTWPETRNALWRGTYTSTSFNVDDVEHEIIRTIAWTGGQGIPKSGLVLRKKVKDGWAQDPGVHIKDVQVSINRLLGLDGTTFMSSILFGQRMSKLVESDNSDKRELFEKLFETAFVNSARAKGKEELNKLIGQEAEAQSDFTVATNLATQKHEDIEERGRIVESFNDTQLNRIRAVKRSIEESNEAVSNMLDRVASYEKTVKDWDQAAYDKFLVDYRKFSDDYLLLEGTSNTLYAKTMSATDQYRRAVIDYDRANEILAMQKQSDKDWAIDRIEKLAKLDEQMKKQMADMKLETIAVADICPACEQDLPEDSVKRVKNSIKIRYHKRIDEIVVEIQVTKDLIPPVSDIASLDRKVKESLDAVDPAKVAQEAAETSYQAHFDSSKDTEESKLDHDGAMVEWRDAFDVFEAATKSVDSCMNDTNTEAAKTEVLEKQLAGIEAETLPTFDYTVKQLETQRDKAINDANHAQEALDDINKEMDRVNWWLKKGYAASGLPAFVFKSMLDKLNDKVVKYADRLGVSVEFSVDLTKATKPFTTICSVGDKVDKEYKEFSGGEKQRLDIVLIFAMHDLVSMETDINILILDEVFEGLDESGEAAVFDLVRTKSEEGKSIYIITHSPHIDSLYSSTLTAVADKTGATKIQ